MPSKLHDLQRRGTAVIGKPPAERSVRSWRNEDCIHLLQAENRRRRNGANDIARRDANLLHVFPVSRARDASPCAEIGSLASCWIVAPAGVAALLPAIRANGSLVEAGEDFKVFCRLIICRHSRYIAIDANNTPRTTSVHVFVRQLCSIFLN